MGLPNGFLGTRADLLMDLVLIGILITPILMLYAFSLAKQKRFVAHRNLHVTLISILILAVILFELDIRLSGGSEAFLSGSPYAETKFMKVLLTFHILIAIASFTTWIGLETQSWKSFREALPGNFSYRHIQVGWVVYSGVVVTAITGLGLYILGFVM